MASTSDLPVIFENRVRWKEVDRQDVVFYGEYYTYQDETQVEYFRKLGYRYEDMEADGWTTHIVHSELDYKRPARYEDVIENCMRVSSIGNSSVTMEYAAYRGEDGALLVEGEVVHAIVDDDTGEAIPVPEDFRDAVVEFQEIPPEFV